MDSEVQYVDLAIWVTKSGYQNNFRLIYWMATFTYAREQYKPREGSSGNIRFCAVIVKQLFFKKKKKAKAYSFIPCLCIFRIEMGNEGCFPTMDLLRSEPMQLVQLIIPIESAHRSISYLGDLGLFQFKDVCILRLYASFFNRHYCRFGFFYSLERVLLLFFHF